MKFVTVTPGISTGYWNDKKIPLWALSSGANSSKSSPFKITEPSVTSYSSFPAITAERVLLPEPLGPIIA